MLRVHIRKGIVTHSGFDDEKQNQSPGKIKQFLPSLSASAVFATYSILIPQNTYHMIEIFVSKRLYNEALQFAS